MENDVASDASSGQQEQQQQQLQQHPNPSATSLARQTRQSASRIGPVRESRIQDRDSKGSQEPTLKIRIELDLEVEVDLYARVKGDVTIGLM